MLAVAVRLTERGRAVRTQASGDGPYDGERLATQANILDTTAQNLRDGVQLNLVTDFDDFAERLARNYERLKDYWRDQATRDRERGDERMAGRRIGLVDAYAEAAATIRRNLPDQRLRTLA